MCAILKNVCLASKFSLGGLLIVISLLVMSNQAPAEEQNADHHDGSGRMGRVGTGLAIGIGGMLLERMTAPHRTDGEAADRPSGKSKKTKLIEKNRDSKRRVGKHEGNPEIDRSGGERLATGGGRSGVPPRGERRYVSDEIITEAAPNSTPQQIEEIARRYNLTQLESQDFSLIGAVLYRWRINGRRSVADVVGAVEDERAIASAQPNYVFTLQEEPVAASSVMHGDSAQYVLQKLKVDDAHRFATGDNVLVAIIDSEVDSSHSDLAGAVVKSFDALGKAGKPHKHGTAIAGAIVSHGKLLGIAPRAQLLAARAFDESAGGAHGTSFAIYKALQWAADNGARVVNMSFSGPLDPLFHRFLAHAYEKGAILVAAAGNAGPKSAPLYPAADSDVIAVTATDVDDNLFKMANRGKYVEIAAPGVDIVADAPANSYQVTTGTSIATAHVSGVVALLLERKQSLKPIEVRALLSQTAEQLGSRNRDHEFGAGIVNAYQAVLSSEGNLARKETTKATKSIGEKN
jgi:subtilisin family serine protease